MRTATKPRETGETVALRVAGLLAGAWAPVEGESFVRRGELESQAAFHLIGSARQLDLGRGRRGIVTRSCVSTGWLGGRRIEMDVVDKFPSRRCALSTSPDASASVERFMRELATA